MLERQRHGRRRTGRTDRLPREHTGGTSAQAQDWLADLRGQDRFLEDIRGG